MNLEFESLIQISPNLLALVALAQYIHFAMSHACIILLHFLGVDCASMCSLWYVLPPRIFTSIQLKGSIPPPLRQASNPLIILIQTHLLASALVYCIKTTRFKLLCVLR